MSRSNPPHLGVPLGHVEHRRLVADRRGTYVRADDANERVHVRIGTRHVQLRKARAQRRRKIALANVRRRIHTRKQTKVGVPRHRRNVATLRQHHAALARLEQLRQTVERLGRGQVHLIQQEPVPRAQRTHQRALDKRKRKRTLLRKHGAKLPRAVRERRPRRRELAVDAPLLALARVRLPLCVQLALRHRRRLGP